MKNILSLILLLFLALNTAFPSGDNTSNKQIVAVRATEQIVIDGKLKEQIWQRAGNVESFSKIRVLCSLR